MIPKQFIEKWMKSWSNYGFGILINMLWQVPLGCTYKFMFHEQKCRKKNPDNFIYCFDNLLDFDLERRLKQNTEDVCEFEYCLKMSLHNIPCDNITFAIQKCTDGFETFAVLFPMLSDPKLLIWSENVNFYVEKSFNLSWQSLLTIPNFLVGHLSIFVNKKAVFWFDDCVLSVIKQAFSYQ